MHSWSCCARLSAKKDEKTWKSSFQARLWLAFLHLFRWSNCGSSAAPPKLCSLWKHWGAPCNPRRPADSGRALAPEAQGIFDKISPLLSSHRLSSWFWRNSSLQSRNNLTEDKKTGRKAGSRLISGVYHELLLMPIYAHVEGQVVVAWRPCWQWYPSAVPIKGRQYQHSVKLQTTSASWLWLEDGPTNGPFFFALQFVGAWNFEPCQFSAVSRHIWKALQMDWDFHNSGTVNSYNHQPTFNGQLFPFQHSWKFSAMHGPSRHLHRCFPIPPPYQFWSWDPLFPGDTFGQCQTPWTWNPCDL